MKRLEKIFRCDFPFCSSLFIFLRRVSSLFNSVGSSHLLRAVAVEVMEAPWESVVETVAQAM